MPRALPTSSTNPLDDSLTNLPKYVREVSVMAWVEDACGQFLMVRQAQGKRLWTLPGGKAKSTETLEAALRRELLEETGERARVAHPIALFDRPEKHNLTILFRVSLVRQRLRTNAAEEISTVAFRSRPPAASTPSAKYFWRLRQSGGFGLH